MYPFLAGNHQSELPTSCLHIHHFPSSIHHLHRRSFFSFSPSEPCPLHECVVSPTCRPSASPCRAPASPSAMQIDPAALSRTDSASNSAKSAAPNAPTTVKSSRALISVPRLDLEHAYTDLKAAVGGKWAEYKESTALFLLGESLRMIAGPGSSCRLSSERRSATNWREFG